MYGAVYLVTNKDNGKRYVGQTCAPDPVTRWKQHVNDADKGRGFVLHRAIREYGEYRFTFEVIWSAASQADLDISEDAFITLFETLCPNGYNLKTGGRRRGKASNELRSVFAESARLRSQRPDYIKNQSAAQRLAQSKPDVKQRHREGLLASWARDGERERRTVIQNDPEINRRRSKSVRAALSNPETKKKMIDANKASWTEARRLAWGKTVQEINNRPGGREKRSIVARAVASRSEQVERFTKLMKGTRFINNGTINKRIREEEALPEGWVFGRIRRR